ncbi:MAG: PilZ domain-containing protein [Methylococcales bacterium]|nr:PilZ domain-containing protein [Methylococcales bacterium]
MTDFREKREFFRMQVDCEIQYKHADGSKESYTGRCTTLSGAGVSFIGSQALNINDTLNVIINPQQTLTPPITAKAVVMRVVSLENDQYEIGATLEILSDN